jgi:hypothetical protein
MEVAGEVLRVEVGGLNRAEAAQYAGWLPDPYPAGQAQRLLPAVSLFHGVADADVLMISSAVERAPGRLAGVSAAEWTLTGLQATDRRRGPARCAR